MAFQEPVAGWPLPSHAPWEVIEGQGEAAEHTVLPGHPGWGQGVHFATALGRPCQVALTGFAGGGGGGAEPGLVCGVGEWMLWTEF